MSKSKLTIKYKSIEELKPYERNARTHSESQVAQIVASIQEFGWTNPIILDGENGILAGHGRLLAARQLGLKDVPTVDLVGLTEAQKRAYILADNKLALNAGWDTDLLRIELSELTALDFDMPLIGFDDKELATLLAEKTEGLTDPDEAPEPPVNPVSQEGDVWILGNHRIICGDSTSADVVARLLGTVKPHLMVTDPPYGVEYDANWRHEAGKTSAAMKTAPHHKHAKGKVENDNRADWREAWALFPGDVAYVWHGSLQTSIVVESLKVSGFKPRSLIVWAKNHFAIGRGDYHPMHEPCWYVVREGKTGHWAGDRKQTTLWQIDKPQKSETGHSTQKPIECMKRPIENNSSPGQAVYEPFSGSGTTIIAGEMTGRHIYAIELNPAYVDVAVNRWQDFTGKEAVHEETGMTFADMSNLRYDANANSAGSYNDAIAALRKDHEQGTSKKKRRAKEEA